MKIRILFHRIFFVSKCYFIPIWLQPEILSRVEIPMKFILRKLPLFCFIMLLKQCMLGQSKNMTG